MIGIEDTAKEFYSRGKRLGSTPKETRKKCEFIAKEKDERGWCIENY